MGSGLIIHVVAARLRVTGTGNLRMSLHSLDDIRSVDLDPVEMEESTNRLVTKLSNFREQQAQLKIQTTDIDETFTIGKFYVFVKPVATSYPM